MAAASTGWRLLQAPPRVVGAYLVCYVLLDWISYIYPAVPPLAITPWNPPPGLSLALLLRYGASNAPWVFVAAFAADLLVRGPHLPPALMVTIPLLTALVYAALALVLKHVLRFRVDFTHLRDAAVFVLAAAVATGLLALSVVGLLGWAGLLGDAGFVMVAAQFWIGDLLGILVMTPLLLIVTRGVRPEPRSRKLELAAQFGAIAAAIWLIFGSGLAQELKLFYVLLLPMIWIAMRHGIEGATFATVVIQVGMILTMWLANYHSQAVLDFQFLLLAVATTGMFLGLTVTERHEVDLQLRTKQEQLDRSLRLAGASEVASALAHELNQPLSAIGYYVQACQVMLRQVEAAPAALRDTMEKAVAEVNRAGSVVRKLREFFRSGSNQLAPAGVDSLLLEAVNSAQRRLQRHRVDCRIDCAPGLPPVQIDRIQIEMVLHNLISNAIDAMKSNTNQPREITLRAAQHDAESVRISVADNGPGVPADIAEHLFTPLASGKPEGMGLGLAICRSIVESHGGRLWFDSTAHGAVFHFTLPLRASKP